MNISAYLPPLEGGYLPAWLLLVSALHPLPQQHTDIPLQLDLHRLRSQQLPMLR